MRIAVVHSFYSSAQPSGENHVVEDQVAALQRAGHEVLLLGRYTDREQRTRLYPLKAAVRVASGRGPDPTERLRAFSPDIVHIHNLFPNIGTSWLRHWEGPVVASVHNYRAVCSNGQLVRDGHACRECIDHGPARAVMHRCYRGSVFATIPVAFSRSRDGVFLLKRADAVVTTSEASNTMLRSVLPFDLSTTVIPNFGADEGQDPLPATDRTGWVALGRLSPEKGFVELIRQWPGDRPLLLIGDGPLRGEIAAATAATSIDFRGSVPREEMRAMLPSRLGLVFPSRWPEAAPQVVVEAMRVGLPVVAHSSNGVSHLVEHSGAGCLYGGRVSLSEALATVEEQCDEMSRAALRLYRSRWTPSVWIAAMTSLYESLLGGHK
jgi:glycosyltransferase involved in cell wall biosynthesis